MKVAIYKINYPNWPSSAKATEIAHAMRHGISRHEGHNNVMIRDSYNGVEADVAVAYGWGHEFIGNIFSDYLKAGKHYVFIDEGHWGRYRSGYYRFAIDSWDSNTHMATGRDGRRLDGPYVKDNFGNHRDPDSNDIMIAPMSEADAVIHEFKYLGWETDIKRHMIDEGIGEGYNIYIREGSLNAPIFNTLKTTRFVITHHSSIAIACIIYGIPFYSEVGVASRIGTNGLYDWAIRYPNPMVFEDRVQLLRDISYTQWNVVEMIKGHAWRYAKEILCELDSSLE